MTWGFFGAHSISSSWVGLRATKGRAQAAALYLFFYYLGSSVGGFGRRAVLSAWGWNGVAALVGGLVFAALSWPGLAKVPPPAGSREELEAPRMEWRDEGVVIGLSGRAKASSDRRGDDARARPPSRPRARRALAKLAAALQPGNTLGLVWRARLDEHLGAFAVEPLTLRAGRLPAAARRRSRARYLGALLRLLPERDPHAGLYEALVVVADRLDDARSRRRWWRVSRPSCWPRPASRSIWRNAPRPGRAKTRSTSRRSRAAQSAPSAGEPWPTGCCRCPHSFLPTTARPDRRGVIAAFRLTGHFLLRDLFQPRGQNLPDLRRAFLAAAHL